MSDTRNDTPARQRLRAALGRLALAEAVQDTVKASLIHDEPPLSPDAERDQAQRKPRPGDS
ncbi:hypothetical protein [Pannonibacter tanglangensis]|uniref:hypothetical protein n=1 Tax=Pannonibacter tanglangensis TaxID=2750084 RepID=UPI0015D33CD0|nr:hypothetical protein [Pannonibacter sp. XCT-34]